jgi:3-hydroxyisobutyrate dehydrogenase-like beta-hydroxyacid dehydrogenase
VSITVAVLGLGEADAAGGADLVLCLTTAKKSAGALRAGIGGAALWADLNTASPGTKRTLADIAAEHGVPFADVAITAPVPATACARPCRPAGRPPRGWRSCSAVCSTKDCQRRSRGIEPTMAAATRDLLARLAAESG